MNLYTEQQMRDAIKMARNGARSEDNIIDSLNFIKQHSEVTMTDRYIIVDLISKEFFKDVDGNVKIFDDYDDALSHCGIYELENAWVCELKHNHIEDNE